MPDLTLSANMDTLLASANNAAARTNLGIAIGTDVLAPNGDGSGLSGVLPLAGGTMIGAINLGGYALFFDESYAWKIAGGGIYDSSGVLSIEWNNRTLHNAAGTAIYDWSSGKLVGDGTGLTGIDATFVGLGNVTNAAQTLASIVPNTAPAAGGLLIGNAGGTAYAPVSLSGDATLASTGAITIANSAVTLAKMANITGPSILGRTTADGVGAPKELVLGTGVLTAMSTAPNATGGIVLFGGTAGALSATSLALTGTAGAGFVNFLTQSSAPTAPASGFGLHADSTGRLSWRRASDGFVRTFDVTATANRVYTLPDATTTLAGLAVANTFTAVQVIQETVGASALTLTGATQTSSFPVLNATQTWNAGAVAFTGIKLNITNTASATTSLLLDLQVGGTSSFNVSRSGNITSPNNITWANVGGSTTIQMHTSGFLVNVLGDYSVGDTFITLRGKSTAGCVLLGKDAAGVQNQFLTAASRITSDGVGANLTISAGNGRGAAGGSLILSYYTTAGAATIGTLTTALTLDTTGLFTIADGVNFAMNGTTGTKWGTATSQKQSFWNKTPIVQPTTGITAAAFVANTSGTVNDSATYGGYTLGQIAAALINVGLLA